MSKHIRKSYNAIDKKLNAQSSNTQPSTGFMAPRKATEELTDVERYVKQIRSMRENRNAS